jgi:enterochelin esterase-like enzyme
VGFSLVGGPFIWVIVIVALVLVVASIRPFTWHRARFVAAVATISIVVAAVGLHEATAVGWIVPALPWHGDLWIATVLFALVWLVVGWRSGTRWTRVAACAALPATCLMALALFNAFFFYFPTFDSLVGKPSADQASVAEVARVRIAAHLRHPISPKDVPAGSATRGVTMPVAFPPTTSHFVTTTGWVYLPPAWFGPQRSHLPVIELIGGTPTTPAEWLRGAQVDRISDNFAAARAGMAPVLVMIDDNGGLTADTECIDRPGSLAETYALRDVRRAMVNRFKVTADPHRWAIAGLSEGGMCALDIGVRHPHSFAMIGNFGGEPRPSLGSPSHTLAALFGGSRAKQAAYDPNRYLRKFHYPNLRIMFVVGTEDTGRRHVVDQAVLARRSGMHVSFRLVKGGHTFRVWRTAFDEFLPYAWRSLSPPSELGSATPVRAAAAERQTVATHCDRDDDLRSRLCPPLRSGSAAPN